MNDSCTANQSYDLFASHRELIEMAVFGSVLGNMDMPFSAQITFYIARRPKRTVAACLIVCDWRAFLVRRVRRHGNGRCRRPVCFGEYAP